MAAAERALFERVLGQDHRHYAEFGMGGSTLLAVRRGFEQIVSVDTDLAWADAIRGHEEIAPSVEAGRTRILHVDIGPLKAWGHPANRNAIHQWPQYVGRMWAEWSALGLSPDLVFVDGRFRAACCLSVALLDRCSGREPPTLMIHDVSPDRPIYQRALKHFDVLEAAQTLHVLKPNRLHDPQAMVAELLELQFVSK